jgi:hypothetical protein
MRRVLPPDYLSPRSVCHYEIMTKRSSLIHMIYAVVADFDLFSPCPANQFSTFLPNYFPSFILFVVGHEQEVTNGTDQRGTSDQG